MEDATSQALKAIRSYHGLSSSSKQRPGNIRRLPDVSEEKMAVVTCIIENCLHTKDVPILLYYGSIFQSRYEKSGGERDIDSLVSILRRASKHQSYVHLEIELAQHLLDRTSFKEIRESEKDIEECIEIARRRLPNSRPLLLAALQKQVDCRLRYLETSPGAKSDKDDNNISTVVLASSGEAQSHQEAALQRSEDDDESSNVEHIMIHFEVIQTLCELGRWDQDGEQRHLAQAQEIFNKVWSERAMVMSTPYMPHCAIVELYGGSLVKLYGLTGGGIEYLGRLSELYSVAASCEFDTIEVVRSACKIMGRAYQERFRRFNALADLRVCIDLWERAVADVDSLANTAGKTWKTTNIKIRDEADIYIVRDLMNAYQILSSLAAHDNHNDASGDWSRKCAQFLHARAQSTNPLEPGTCVHRELICAASGYLFHVDIGGYDMNDKEHLDSLRQAISILFSEELLQLAPQNVHETFYLDAVHQLAQTLSSLFVATSNFNFFESALLCRRAIVFHTPKGGVPHQLPSFQNALAKSIYLRQIYMRSQPLKGIIEDKPTDISLRQAYHGISDLLGLDDSGTGQYANLQGTLKLFPPRSLDARLATGDDVDGDDEWFRLFCDSLKILRVLADKKEHRCEHHSTHLLDLVSTLASFASHSFHDKYREVSIQSFRDAISILQQFFLSQPSVRLQQTILENNNNEMRYILDIPSVAASFAISWGRVDLAVEFLELGRSLIWSRMRGLWGAEAELVGVDERLRDRYRNVCEALGNILTRDPAPDPLDFIQKDDDPTVRRGLKVDQPIDIVARRKLLEKEFASVVREIRGIHGYEEFLQVMPYHKLRFAASEGPIIILTIASSSLHAVRLPIDEVGSAVIVWDQEASPVSVQLGEGLAFQQKVSGIIHTLTGIRRMLRKVPIQIALLQLRSTLSQLLKNSRVEHGDNHDQTNSLTPQLDEGNLESLTRVLEDVSRCLAAIRSEDPETLANGRWVRHGNFAKKLSTFDSMLSDMCVTPNPGSLNVRESEEFKPAFSGFQLPLVTNELIDTTIGDIDTALKDVRIVLQRKSNETLENVLDDIGELLVKKVVHKLRELGIKKHSRIWWCPTSSFTTFPLHAAIWREPVGKKDKQRCLSDFYVSSYTPSLSALIRARSSPVLSDAPVTIEGECSRASKPSMLLVGQQDGSLKAVSDEIEAAESVAKEAGLVGDTKPGKIFVGGPKNSDENERDKVLDDLKTRSWVHLACHGIMDESDPFSSHFQIRNRDNKPITLIDIARLKVPNAEFAFLSACHSAEQAVGVSDDESLHLAAAMQFSGFRSVIGTLWPLKDDDGPQVAESFYRYMFAEPKEGEEEGYKRSARALRKVVQDMRRNPKYIHTPERWVNFVHIGA